MSRKLDWKSIIPKSFPKKNQLLVMLLAGILLLVIALPAPDKQTEKETGTGGVQEAYHSSEAYEKEMERRLEEILSEVEGVGEVKVMITLKASAEKVVEKDLEENSQSIEETDQGGGNRITKEKSSGETTIYGSTAEANQEPYVSKEISPQIEGVLVIAGGGNQAVVIQNITEAIQALFDVDTHKIKIMKRN